MVFKGDDFISNLKLVVPSKEYENSFKSYTRSYKDSNDFYYYEKYKKGIDNFDDYLLDLYKLSNGIDIKVDEVQTSTFWLIDENEVVGVTRVRHEELDTAGHIGYDISPLSRNKGYGTIILRLALLKAKKLGIEEAIVTCNVDNVASRKIIENNNGKFIEVIFDEEENEYLDKFSISTKIG